MCRGGPGTTVPMSAEGRHPPHTGPQGPGLQNGLMTVMCAIVDVVAICTAAHPTLGGWQWSQVGRARGVRGSWPPCPGRAARGTTRAPAGRAPGRGDTEPPRCPWVLGQGCGTCGLMATTIKVPGPREQGGQPWRSEHGPQTVTHPPSSPHGPAGGSHLWPCKSLALSSLPVTQGWVRTLGAVGTGGRTLNVRLKWVGRGGAEQCPPKPMST